MIGVSHFLILSALLFCVGLFGMLSRRNVIGLLMSVEILFNAVGINFVAMNRYLYPEALWGQGMTMFLIALAAAESVVGLALVLAIYRQCKTVLVEKLNILSG